MRLGMPGGRVAALDGSGSSVDAKVVVAASGSVSVTSAEEVVTES